MSSSLAEAAITAGRNDYKKKKYKSALEQFTNAIRLCKCNRGIKRDPCSCKNFEAVATAKDGDIFHEAMYNCTCSVGKTFNKCDNPAHIKALDYRAATLETLNQLPRARRDAEWMLELAPRLPDGYLRLAKVAALQKRDKFAWEIYNAGISVGRANGMTSHPKFQLLYIARKNLHFRFYRRDPISLPAELFMSILFYCNLQTRIRCLGVCKRWNQMLSSPDFASLWKVLDFSPFSRLRSLLRKGSLEKLLARAGHDVRKIVFYGDDQICHISETMFSTLLKGAVCLEHLELSFTDTNHGFRIPPTARLCKTLKTLSLVNYYETNLFLPNSAVFVDSSINLAALINAVAQSIQTLNLCGLPHYWHQGQNVPVMAKLKNLRLQVNRTSYSPFPILSLGTSFPSLEQLWLDGLIACDWGTEWDKSLPNLKTLIINHSRTIVPSMPPDSAVHLLSSMSYGRELEYIDLSLPWAHNHDVLNMAGAVHEYKKLQAIRIARFALNPDSLQQAVGSQAAAGKLHTLYIVFPGDWSRLQVGAHSRAYLAKYGWLVGSAGIRCMSISQFRFQAFARGAEQMPLPSFLASFPNLETLEIGSDHYQDDQTFCSIILAIIKEVPQLKLIYQYQIQGTLMDQLHMEAKTRVVDMVWGKMSREWPVLL